MTGELRSGPVLGRVLALTVLALVLAQLATAIACALIGGVSFADAVGSFTVTNGAMGLAFAVCGVLLAWHRPRNAIGWLFLAAGLGHATSAAAVQLLGLGAKSGWDVGALRLLASVFSYAWPWSIGLLLPMALLLFPDGHLTSRRWRPIAWAAAAEGLLFLASAANPAPAVIEHRRIVVYLAIGAYRKLGILWTVSNIAWAVIFPCLTSREREVLDHIATGARNAEIARRMAVAPKTVANHISAIFAKLRIADRSAAIVLAGDAGLGRDAL